MAGHDPTVADPPANAGSPKAGAGLAAHERAASEGPLVEPAGLRWLRWLARAAALAYTGLLLVMTHLPRVDPGTTGTPLIPMDKLAHVLAFGLLVGILALAKPIGARVPWRWTLLIAAGLAFALAWGIEQTQPWTGRTGSMADLMAGLGGILAAYVVLGARPAGRGAGWAIWLVRGLGLMLLPGLVLAALTPWGNHLMIEWGPTIGLHHTWDKVLHYYVAAGLLVLVALTWPAGRRHPRLGAALAVAAVAGSSLVIEWIQPHTGRGPASPGDVAAHMAGMIPGLAIWAAAATTRDAIGWLSRAGVLRALGHAGGLVIGTRAGRADEGTHDPPTGSDGHAATTATTPDPSAETGETTETGKPAKTGESNQATDAGAHADQPRSTLAGHATLISVITLLSRVTGLIRDATLAAIFGVSAVADAFFIGFLVPNLFRRLFGEGALAAAFIPRYSELRQRDPTLAKRFAGLSLAGLLVVLAGITLAGEALLWALSRGGWAGTEGGQLALELTMWMLPYMPLVCAIALIGGMLQVHRRFGPPAAAPIVLNLVIVGATLWASWEYAATITLPMLARVAAGAVLVAGVIQLGWQWLAVREATGFSLNPAGLGPPMKRMLKAVGPLVLGLAAFQINAFLDSFIALMLSAREPGATFSVLGTTLAYPMETGAVASLQWAQRLYQFPLGVFGIAVATAIFPALAEAASERPAHNAGQGTTASGETPGDDRLARILRQGLRLTFFIGLPASVGLLLVRTPVVRVIYERGAFTLADSERIALILAGYASAVWAYSIAHVVTRCFYAVGDERAPVRISATMVGLNLLLNAFLIWPLGAAGLAWSTAICAAGQAIWLLYRVKRHVSTPIDGAVKRSWQRTAALTLIMAGVVGALGWFFDATAMSWWAVLGLLTAMVGAGMAIILGGARLTGAAELTWLLNRRARD